MVKLYYYTGQKHLRDLLQKKRVKLSRFGRFGTLNDPFELAPYDISDPKIRSPHKDALNQIGKMAGLICLSETWRSPAMWAHYADKHEGACLEFEVTLDTLTKVKYRKQKLFQGITLDNYDSKVNEDNIEKLLSTKSRDWDYEKEHRILVPLDNETVIFDDGHHFLPFQKDDHSTFLLKRVFVGYRCGKGISNMLEDLKGYTHKVKVLQTRPAFKSFKVTRQKDKKFWNWDECKQGEECSLPAVRAVFG